MRNRKDTRRFITGALVSVLVIFFASNSFLEKQGGSINAESSALPFAQEVLGFLKDVGSTDNNSRNSAQNKITANDGIVTVHFIDVEQGESILITAPEKTVLIDAGENDMGKRVVRYLKDEGIDFIDIAIGTHPHSDHIGGMDTVLLEIPAETVLFPHIPDEVIPTTRTFEDFLDAVEKIQADFIIAEPYDSFDLGGGAVLEILGPQKNYDDLNELSIISRLDFGETSFLFTGDAGKISELDLIEAGVNLEATVLNVGHHGSKGSTVDEFLAEVNPEIAAISLGADNSYGHPHRRVIEALNSFNAEIYRTDRHGNIVMISDGTTVEVETQNAA